MQKKRLATLVLATFTAFVMLVALALVFQVRTVRSQEPAESTRELEKAVAAEQSGAQVRTPVGNPSNPGGGGFELFAGLDDITVPAFRIDPATNAFQQVFDGIEVWGAAYDYDNDQVYVSDGTGLYVWPVGSPTVTFLATVSDTTGINVSMEGLAYYDGVLYASKVGTTGEGEGIYNVDLTTYQATRVIAYVDPAATTISGIDADPQTGQIYGTNDNSALRGLVAINPDGTVTLVAPYQGTETDVDGLAVGGGRAYLITDDATPPYFEVYDFAAMAYVQPVSSPFTTTEVFAGGAWISPAGESLTCNGPTVQFDAGIPATWITATTTGPVYWTTTADATGCDNPYEVGGIPPGACADADTTNTGGDPYDTEMWSNAFDLTGYTAASLDLRYRHRNLNNSTFNIDISTDGGATWTNVFTNTAGNPGGNAGDVLSIDLASYLGQTDVTARFRYYGDAWDWYSQVDEVELNCLEPGQPVIEVQKTVGTDPAVCAAGDSIYVTPGTDVTYCYEVTNTGNVTLTLHDLEDSALGTILSGFPYDLAPGANAFVTQTANITQTTVNTATWTAYNPGPSDVALANDTATVNVVDAVQFPTCIDFESGSLPSSMYPLTTSSGAANGRVQVTTAFPHTGSYALDIDTDCDGCGGSTLQSATLVADLAGETNVLLDFWVHEHGDENNAEDGVFISDDGGTTWAQIVDLTGFPDNYENVVLDLAAAASGVGMNLVDGFQIRFQSFDNFSIPTDGYSFDDICLQPDVAHIEVAKTVGTDPAVCAATSNITVEPGTDVYYCYEVTNTGNFTLTLHDLDDSEFGSIFTALPYTLTPGASVDTVAAGLVISTTVMTDTTNTATWTAYNPGPSDVATDTATASVAVVGLPDIEVSPNSLESTQAPDTQVTLPLDISNVGTGALDWMIIEEAAPAAGVSTYVPRDPADYPVVTSPAECEAYTDYAGREPLGWAEHCMTDKPETSGGSLLGPTDIGYAHDIGFVSDNFVMHELGDFPGQTVVAQSTLAIYGYDFDRTATTLYAVDDVGMLGTVDTATAAFTPIGSTGVTATPTGLSIDPVTNEAYLSATDGATTSLYSVDLATGVATLIGSQTTTPLLIDISISPTGEMYGHDISTDSIYMIDRTTGAATLVGPTGVDSNFAQGMDFDNTDGTLYAYTYQGGGANVYGTIDLATGLLTPLATSNPQGEFEGATQTIGLETCDMPADIPWASVSPTSGTTLPGATDTVDVTFDSTGLASGTYTGTLCVESNDLVDPVVRVPLTLTVTEVIPPMPSIAVTATVGTDPATCATDSSIVVGQPTTVVYYCYTVTNTGNITLPFHDIMDDVGTNLTGVAYDLAPGETANTVALGLTISETVSSSTTNTVVWTAYVDSQTTATASSTAAVTEQPTDVALSNFSGDSGGALASVWLALMLTLVLGFALWFRRSRTEA